MTLVCRPLFNDRSDIDKEERRTTTKATQPGCSLPPPLSEMSADVRLTINSRPSGGCRIRSILSQRLEGSRRLNLPLKVIQCLHGSWLHLRHLVGFPGSVRFANQPTGDDRADWRSFGLCELSFPQFFVWSSS